MVISTKVLESRGDLREPACENGSLNRRDVTCGIIIPAEEAFET